MLWNDRPIWTTDQPSCKRAYGIQHLAVHEGSYVCFHDPWGMLRGFTHKSVRADIAKLLVCSKHFCQESCMRIGEWRTLSFISWVHYHSDTSPISMLLFSPILKEYRLPAVLIAGTGQETCCTAYPLCLQSDLGIQERVSPHL